uniref:uncharacterized protein n=1 Tax=Pristiophorus japonicus TaxID=55135 RepID=UPI00398F227F
MKKRWNQVAEDYCAVVTTTRSGGQCKKKWQDLGQVVSSKVTHNKRERTQTGGGPATLYPLTPLEERVAAFMGFVWRKATSTAQAGSTLEGEEREANPDDAEEDSDTDKPEEENIFQSNPPDQHGGEGMELDEAPTVVLTLEEVPLITVTAPSVTSGLRVDRTFHGFTPSEVAGPSGGMRATSRAPPSQAAGPSGGVQRGTPRAPPSQAAGPSDVVQRATPRAPPSQAAGPSGGVQRGTPRAPLSQAAGPSGGVQRGTPRAPLSQAAGPSGGVRAAPVGRRGRRARPHSPEVQDLTDVVQMMSLTTESIDLTQSLLDTISGVSDEVAGLLGEITAMTREMGMTFVTISEGIVAMREGMSEVVQTTSLTMREGMLQVVETLFGCMRDGMLELAAAIREHTQTPRPLTQSTVSPTPIRTPVSEEPKAGPSNCRLGLPN